MTFLEFLIKKAKNKHGNIEPCLKNREWRDSVTIVSLDSNKNAIMFWYNSKDGSTHCITITLQDLANMEIE